MTTNLKTFEKELRRFSHEVLPTVITEQQHSLAREALRGLVARTPVKTGRTRANWQVTLDAPAQGVLDTQDPSGANTIGLGEEVIARSKPFESIWITNNLPTLGALEHGGLDRAPVAMVAATLASLSNRNRRGGNT